MCKSHFGASIKGEGILDYALEKNMMDYNDNEYSGSVVKTKI